MDGVITTNTTLSRDGVCLAPGRRDRRAERRAAGRAEPGDDPPDPCLTGGKLPVIGVGGVMSPADARLRLEAGASLVQVYTGLVYARAGAGPI